MVINKVYLKMEAEGFSKNGERVKISLTEELGMSPDDRFVNEQTLIGDQIIEMYKTLSRDFQIDIDETKVVTGGNPYGQRIIKKTEPIENPSSSVSPFTKIAGELNDFGDLQ